MVTMNPGIMQCALTILPLFEANHGPSCAVVKLQKISENGYLQIENYDIKLKLNQEAV